MKRIFLTGASSGIGLAIAQRLCAEGHEVWGTARKIERLPALPSLHPVALDLADRESLGETFRTALRQAERFDVVINNAGSGYFGPAENLSPNELARHFQVLVFGQLELMHLALESMRQGNGGLIINVSSLASRLPVPYMAAYNAAKAAMASYTFSLQLELDRGGVQIIDLQPADICTNFNDAISPAPAGDPRVSRAWSVVSRNLQNAPPPQLVARRILRLVESSNPPPRSTVGDIFQSRIAPLIFRFLPQRVRVWGLKKYYGI